MANNVKKSGLQTLHGVPLNVLKGDSIIGTQYITVYYENHYYRKNQKVLFGLGG